MTNKCTLIIDGNWLLISRLFMYVDKFKLDTPEATKEQGKRELEEMLARSINVVLRTFKGVVDNVILVSDGHSWRKGVKTPSNYPKDVYKANRGKETGAFGQCDWDFVFSFFDEFITKHQDSGLMVARCYNAEGDDQIWYWSTKLNNQGINTIIWSSDNDLKQLVGVKNGAFTIWYNSKSGLILPNVLNKDTGDDIDFFLLMDFESPMVKKLKKCVDKVTYINPDEIVMKKIICGDSSDNIKSIIQTQINNRCYGVGKTKVDRIVKDLQITSLDDFFDRKMDIIKYILNNRKFTGVKMDDVVEAFEYNKTLIWLNEQCIPKNVLENMDVEYVVYSDLDSLTNQYDYIINKNLDVLSIFESIDDAPF